MDHNSRLFEASATETIALLERAALDIGGRDAAVQRVNGAICKMFADAGLDSAYGLTLPQKS